MLLVLGIFLEEAERTIARIAQGLDGPDHDKATHFLRSGALNIGLVSLAAEANIAAEAAPQDRAATAISLRDTLHESIARLGLPVGAR